MHRIDAHLGGVRWAGEFEVDRSGRWEYTIEAWTDVFGTWRDELARKVAAAASERALGRRDSSGGRSALLRERPLAARARAAQGRSER